MDIYKAQEAYHSNPEFRSLVDMMIGAIINLEFSPSEMRAAAMFACIRFEQMNPQPRPLVLSREEAEKFGISIKEQG